MRNYIIGVSKEVSPQRFIRCTGDYHVIDNGFLAIINRIEGVPATTFALPYGEWIYCGIVGEDGKVIGITDWPGGF